MLTDYHWHLREDEDDSPPESFTFTNENVDRYVAAAEAIAESGVAVEVSTAGLRKPVGEMYPAADLGRMCVEAGAVFSLSSDAHTPAEIGYAYERAGEEMRSWGIEEIAVFEHRR